MKEKFQKYLFWLALLLIFSVFSFFLVKEIKLWRSPVGSCGFFSQKYCRQAKISDFQGWKSVAFRIPDGMTIHSPFVGEYSGGSLMDVEGQTANIIVLDETVDYKPTGRRAFLIGYCDPVLNPIGLAIKNLNKGDAICTVNNEEQLFDSYNIFISLGNFNKETKEFFPDEKILKEFFPYVK